MAVLGQSQADGIPCDLSFPKEEAGYDIAVSHPAIHGWLGRVAKLPGWRPPYDLLPGKRLKLHV
jgi:glutathione S-transferase